MSKAERLRGLVSKLYEMADGAGVRAVYNQSLANRERESEVWVAPESRAALVAMYRAQADAAANRKQELAWLANHVEQILDQEGE
jgi:hypothetical protein